MRRPSVKPRRAIFIGVEGISDRAFVRFLARCCGRKGLHLYLDVKPAGGGDSVAVVESSARYMSKRSGYSEQLVLLDNDRIEQDKNAGRNAEVVASANSLEIILLNPKLEGLLLRLHAGHERRQVRAQDALKELKKVWPEYGKPPTADQLDQRFDVPDLLRVAQHDEHLQRLLEILGFSHF